MGFISKLFGKRDHSSTFVRDWVNREKTKTEKEAGLSVENIFVACMFGLTLFCNKNAEIKYDVKFNGTGLDPAEQFSTDATLFEVGCYMLFRLDLWLFNKYPGIRENLIMIFNREFVKLFNVAVNIEVQDIFSQRLEIYGQLIREEANLEKLHFILMQIIKRTKNGKLPVFFNSKNEYMQITIEDMSYFSDTGLKMELLAWEEHVLPALFESMENFINIIKQQSNENAGNSNDKIYLNKNLIKKEYLLSGDKLQIRFNAALLSGLLLSAKDDGWQGGNKLFTIKNGVSILKSGISGTYITQADAFELNNVLSSKLNGRDDQELDTIISPFLNLCSQGGFKIEENELYANIEPED